MALTHESVTYPPCTEEDDIGRYPLLRPIDSLNRAESQGCTPDQVERVAEESAFVQDEELSRCW